MLAIKLGLLAGLLFILIVIKVTEEKEDDNE